MAFILIISFLFRLVLSFLTWHPDVATNADWGTRFFQYGAGKFYAPESNVWSFAWPNQPPGSIYIFASVRKLFEFLFAVFSDAHFNLHIFPGSWLLFLESNLYPALLKLPAILADLGIAYIIYRILREIRGKKEGIVGVVLWLVNPVVWYNSSLWGQTDSIVNFFALLSFYLLLQRKLNLSLVAFALSLYIKASLLIFLPIYLIIAIRQKYKISQYLVSIVFCLVLIALLTVPFSLPAQAGRGEPFSWLINLYKDKVFTQQLHVVSANAFNFWGILFGVKDSAVEVSGNVLFGPISYKLWGYLLFGLTYIPSLYLVYKKQDTKSVVWALAISAFSSFMLLTNMHERYLYPLFPYLTILVASGFIGNWYYWTVAIIGLLNLYNFWWFPRIDFLINLLSFGDRVVPRILATLNLGLFVYLYSRFLRILKTLWYN